VQQAHDHGIIHRDLKPENLRVVKRGDDEDFVKVLDFGLAKLRDNEEHARASITREGFLVGTPYYMAPEHIRGEPVDARTDVYALGALMYKACVGVPPFWGPTPVAVLTKHLHDDVIPPTKRSQRHDLPAVADRILMKALEKKPADRYQSMIEMRADLAEYLAGIGMAVDSGRMREPTEAARVTTPEGKVVVATRGDVDRYERRLRLAAYAQALFLVALVSVGVAGGAWLIRGGAPHLGTAMTESEPNDSPEEATPLPRGEALTAYLGRRHDRAHGDVDVYELDASDGARVATIDVTAPPNVDIELDLYRHDRSESILHVDRATVGHGEHVENFPFEATTYFLRVREVEDRVVFPTENVSDTYAVRWTDHEVTPSEEHELNDDVARANPVHLGETRTAFMGWSADHDVFCLAEDVPAAVIEAAGPGLDLVLTIHEPVTDREHVVNTPGVGETERWSSSEVVAAGTCATVVELASSARTSSDGAYTLTVRAP
jgi:serine/threonine-protein kinase